MKVLAPGRPTPIRRAIPGGVAALTAFSTAAVGAGLGRALVTAYLPVLLERIRDEPGLIGSVMLVNAAAGFVVPLCIGIWSDRLARRGHSRVFPFVLGGSIVTALGLAAIAIGSGTSYFVLALFALVTYVGLNSVTTAHRALIPELFGTSRRGKATGAEEFAMLLGGVAGVVAGGVLVEFASWAPFVFGAFAVPLLAVPTVARLRGIRPRPATKVTPQRPPVRQLVSIARRRGVRAVLAAQALWVLGYLGLPPFFILYAERVFGLTPSASGVALAAFGVVTGMAMLGAGTAGVRAHVPLVVLGVVLIAGGLLSVVPASSLGLAAPGLAAAAVGFGIVSTLGFPVLSRYIPAGEEGAYTALYFAVRAVAATVAVPAAGWTIAATGSYRALVLFGAAATALALLPLLQLVREDARHFRSQWAGLSWYARWAASVTALLLVSVGVGLLSIHTALGRADEWLFGALQGGSVGHGLLSALLDELAFANYLLLTLIAFGAALRRGRRLATALLVPVSGLLAWGIVRAVWALVERERPEELLSSPTVHSWAHVSSFPSGHVAVTVALVVATTWLFPGLRAFLWTYAALLSVSRIFFGAHFPTDILVGAAIGVGSALLVWSLLVKHGVRLPALNVPWSEGPFRPGSQEQARARRVGLALGAAVVIAFFVLAQAVGFPQNPDGTLLDPAVQVDLQHALLDIAGLAVVVALLRGFVGGAVLVGAALLLGLLATIEYDPLVALLTFLAFLAPGTLLLISAVRTRYGALAVASVLIGVVAIGGVAAEQVHAYFTGPTHPASPVRVPPAQDVDWAWAGAVTASSFDVRARLRTDGEIVRLHVWSVDGTDSRVLPALEVAEDVASFTVTGLRPGTEYRYALEVGGTLDRARTGHLRTFPEGAASFSFAFSSCARVGSNGRVFDAIRREEPLLFLAVGDLFYGNVNSNDPDAFRHLYGELLRQPAPGLLFRSTSLGYVWDDHDFGPDGANRLAASAPAAEQVYRELFPSYPLPGGANEGPIYQAFDVGRVRFVMTDTRSERDPQAKPDDASKTMLGPRQKAWLKRELLRARDRYALTVWVNPDPWIGSASEGADGWGGYATERRELADFIATNGIRNILMLSGDAHMLGIDDGSNSDYSALGEAAFPIMHAAALDKHGGVKGGPYSEGVFPGSGQFGLVTVRDVGNDISLTLSGRDYTGRELIHFEFSVPASAP